MRGTRQPAPCGRSALLIAFLALLALLGSGCTGDGSSITLAEFPERDESNLPGLSTSAASGFDLVSAETPAPAVEAIESLVDEYLMTRSAVVVNRENIEALQRIATPQAVAQVTDARQLNDQRLADDWASAMTQLFMWSNIYDVRQTTDTRVEVLDCTERHEVDRSGDLTVYFVTNRIGLEVNSGDLLVASLETLHNGFFEQDAPLGCAPQSFKERGEATAEQAWTELTARERDLSTQGDGGASLPEVIADPIRSEVLASEEGATLELLESAEEVTFVAAGLDNAKSFGRDNGAGTVVVVETCHYFPQGRSALDVSTGETVPILSPGSFDSLRLLVELDLRGGSSNDRLIDITDGGSQC